MNFELGMLAMLESDEADEPEARGGPPSTANAPSTAPTANAPSTAPAETRRSSVSSVSSADEAARRRKRRSGGLAQIALCADGKQDSAQARQVQCMALSLLAAAAIFSEEGHAQVRPSDALGCPLMPFDAL
jgi:hypothetical protein